jgi:hypothetical protein
MFDDDLLDPIGDVTHPFFSFSGLLEMVSRTERLGIRHHRRRPPGPHRAQESRCGHIARFLGAAKPAEPTLNSA